MDKITTCLWFDRQAEEAAQFYTSIFKNSKIGTITRSTDEIAQAGGGEAGSVLTVNFELDGREFMGLNGGPMFKFSEAISLMVHCEDQAEIDHFWAKLTEGGEESACGWLKDKFGLSWQIVPKALSKIMADPDPDRFARVMHEVLKMGKLDLATIERAYEG